MKSLLMAIALFFFVGFCSAQEVTTDQVQYVQVKLKNGKVVVGDLVLLTDSLVQVDTDLGEISIKRSDTKELQLSNVPFNRKEASAGIAFLEEEEWFSDWYSIMPTARPTGAGKANYRNDYLFLHRFSLGLSDNFSLDAGFEVISVFAGQAPSIWVVPKYSFGSEDSYFSVGSGVILVTGSELDDATAAFLPFANYTVGSQGRNYTFGISYATTTEDLEDSSIVLNFGTNQQISKNVAFTAELLYAERSLVGQFGVNIRTNRNIMFRLGLIRPFDSLDDVAVPVLGISMPLK